MNILGEDTIDSYEKGWDAYEYGKSLEDNPYDPKDVDYNNWRKGYLESSEFWEDNR